MEDCVLCLYFLMLVQAAQGLGSSGEKIIYSSVGANVILHSGRNDRRSCTAVHWRQGGQFLFSSNVVQSGMVTVDSPERARRLKLGSDCSLRIDNLHAEDGRQYTYQDEATNTTISLQLLNITVNSNKKWTVNAQVSLHCYLSIFSGLVRCDHSGVNVSWVSETGGRLTGDRYKISSPSVCHSNLTFTLRRTDHNRKWRCQLTQGKEVKTSLSYTTKLADGAEEVFAEEGESVTFPCTDPAPLSEGGKLQWSLGEKVLFVLGPGGNVTSLPDRGTPEMRMSPGASLLIKAVTANLTGYYRCSQHGTTDLVMTHKRILLHTLKLNADSMGTSHSNLTLTCSLTCADVCDEDLTLTWSQSSGGYLQGADVGQGISSRISQLSLPELQSSERIACVVLREDSEKARVEWSNHGVRHVLIATVTAVCVLVLLCCIIGAAVYVNRRQKTQSNVVYDNVRMNPLYHECGACH